MCAADAARTARATREGTSTTTTTATATTATTAVEARKGLRQAMEVTPEASRRIKALLDARQKEYLKIGVKTRGCNGMTYTMNYADESERKKFDELVTTEDGVKIIVEPNALMSIIGTKMDYVSDRLRSEFVFENPNSKAQCGCGESFTV
jgi:iron-sulfur cluster assembly protein